MQLAEAEIRPRKPLFHLATAEAILVEAHAAIGDNEPKSSAGRAAFLAVLRKTLSAARKSAEAELRRRAAASSARRTSRRPRTS